MSSKNPDPSGVENEATVLREILQDLIADMHRVADWNPMSAASQGLELLVERAEKRLRELDESQ